MNPPPKDFVDFITNHWPHLVAEVRWHTKLLYGVVLTIVGAAIAVIVAG